MYNLNSIETELHKKLTILALERSKSFCYQCYRECPSGVCIICHTDDLMRVLDGVGCEYGTDWIIESILEQELDPVTDDDLQEQHGEMIESCYGEMIKIGWFEVSTVEAIKCLDPVSYELSMSEYLDNQREDEILCSFDNGGTHYWTHDVEALVEHIELEEIEQKVTEAIKIS